MVTPSSLPSERPARRRRIQPFEVLVAGALLFALWAILGPSAPGSWDTGALTGGGPDSDTIATGDRRRELSATHPRVSFSLLSGYTYGGASTPARTPWKTAGPTPPPSQSIPDDVQALDGRKVAIEGFMLPLEADEFGVGRFILNANQDMCYFGAPTRITDLVMVRFTGGRRTALTHMPIVVFGTLSVGEERQGSRVVSLYRLEAEAIAAGTYYPM